MAQEAIDNAKFICEDYYGLFRGPEVHLHCRKDLEFMYVPSHLSHMLFELLKNSLRAVVEQYGTECDEYPPIKLIVAQGKEVRAVNPCFRQFAWNGLCLSAKTQNTHYLIEISFDVKNTCRILPSRFRMRAAEFPGVECHWCGPICTQQHHRSMSTLRSTSRTLRHPWQDLVMVSP